MKKNLFLRRSPPFFVLLFGVIIYISLFYLDNKYTAAVPGGYGRALWQTGDDGPSFLIDGWEYYPGELLAPEDFAAGVQPESYTYIGQQSNFSQDLGTPYGTATYRLVLENNGPTQEMLFYLPELLCAGRVYINGVLVGEQGSLNPYTPQMMDGVYAFTMGQRTEILIQCANYTHYYSGLYYPPAVGTAQAINRMLVIRLAVYGLLCFSALTLALVYLVQWALSRDAGLRQMGLLSLGYAVRICYPFLRALGLPALRVLYALEDVTGNLVLLCALLLAGELSGAVARWYHRRIGAPAAVALCCFTLIFPLFILPYAPSFINLYGILLFLWKLIAALYLLFLAARTARTASPLRVYLLCAALFFGLSLAVTVLTANRLEPIYGPWPVEYGGFALVVGFAAMIIQQNLLITRENARLTRHLQEEVARKTQSMERLLQERRELLASVLHDLKNPLSALCSYAELVRYGGVALDAETEGYLNALSARAGTVRDRLNALQDFSRAERGLSHAAPLCLNDFLQDFYETNRPDMELSGVGFDLRLPPESLFVRGAADLLQTALENLCYNALSFTPDDGTVTLRLTREEDTAVVAVIDTGCGIAPEDLPHLFERGFTKRPDNSGEGLGLFLVRAVALEHGGNVEVTSTPGQGSTFFLRLPLVPPPAV